MEYIDIEDIKPGDIILTCNGYFISYINADKEVSHWISIYGNTYSNHEYDPCDISQPTKASNSQIQHLKACMKIDKYVELIEEEMNENYKGELQGFPREIVEKEIIIDHSDIKDLIKIFKL